MTILFSIDFGLRYKNNFLQIEKGHTLGRTFGVLTLKSHKMVLAGGKKLEFSLFLGNPMLFSIILHAGIPAGYIWNVII